MSCTHQGGHPGGMQGQGRRLRTAAPGKGPDFFRGQIPTSPCGHQALHPSRGGHQGRHGFFIHRTNPYQGPHQPSEQWSLRQQLAKESLQLRTYRTEFSPLGCGWTPTTGPALAARLYARPLCRDLPCPTEVQWHVPQLLEQWNVCGAVRGWQQAVFLGPYAWRQQRCGLYIPQTSGHRQSQSEIRQALAGDHHTDSLCPVW